MEKFLTISTKPFISTVECFKKYKNEWEKPSLCYHIDEKGLNFKQCIKCGRVIFVENGRKYFYLANGSRYLIGKKL